MALLSARRDRSLDDVQALGADVIRSLVYWNRIAPDGRRKPRGDLSEPAAYPAPAWDLLDDLVRATSARGLELLLSPSGPAPLWASTCKSKAPACNPDPVAFGRFVSALGKRYSGAYADENQGGGVLPRVSSWSIWNEPNQPGWLSPQAVKLGRHVVITAAHQYRRLATAGLEALRDGGHGADRLLLGETAPLGRVTGSLARRPTPPVVFIRELLCLDAAGRKLRGEAARVRGCSRFRRLPVTGYAHHPYTRGGSQPPRSRSLPGEITMGSIARLETLLRRGAAARRLPRRLPIWSTEFGYQTNPPDRQFGISFEEAAEYMNEADWIAYRNRSIAAVAQYKLFDEDDPAGFQTGLRFATGRVKPTFDAYRLPIWVSRAGAGRVRVYGQVRPAASGATEQVEILRQPAGGGAFAPVETIAVASERGHFLVTEPGGEPGERWQLKWQPSDGAPPVFSREARVGAR